MSVQSYKPPFPYLKQSQKGTRTNRLSMAAPMLARWRYSASKTYIQNLADLVAWMDVENSKRWYPENGATYCDELVTFTT